MQLLMEYMKTCPVCEEEYEAKRLNQTYCSIQCKARFNNHKAKSSKIIYETVTKNKNEILWRNRNILAKYDNQEVEIEQLKREGFQLNFVTNFSMDKKTKKNILIVYDCMYIFLDEKTIKIKQNE